MVRKADRLFVFRESQRTVRDWNTTKSGKKSMHILHVNKFKNGYAFDLKIKLCNYKPRIEDIFKETKSKQKEYYYVSREYINKSSIDKAIRIGLNILNTNKCYTDETDKLLLKLPKGEIWD